MNQKQLKIDSAIGPLYLIASETHLLGVHWGQQDIDMVANTKHANILGNADKQLTEYFNGERQHFDLPLLAEGTAFQERVWAALIKIPYGETRSYQDIAQNILNPKACRAVGTANGCNPISIIVPCHRVIAADGTLGGYGGGLAIKTKLLELESRVSTSFRK